jgi:hypothetical protein
VATDIHLDHTFWICALSVVFSASPGALRCGKDDCHCLYCESVHSSFCVSFIFIHCLKPVGVCCELVCWTIFLLVVSLSSLEFLPVALNFFLCLNSLSLDKSPSTFPPRNNFLSHFPTTMSLPLLFVTVLISYCAKIFHRALWPCSGLLGLIFLVTQSFCHCLFDRSLRSTSFSFSRREGVTVHYRTCEKNTHWHHDNIPKHKKEGAKWQGREV